MTNNRLLVFIAVVLSVLTIAVIWVGITVFKSQEPTTEQDNVTSEIKEVIVPEDSLQDEMLIEEPLQNVENIEISEDRVVENVEIEDDEYVSAGTGVLYDETDDYHPATGEPLYWVDGVEVTAKQWYEATGGAEEGRSSLEEIEEMRRGGSPY
ncbi:hypothetical protein I3249_06310 [Psychrobacter sp. Ps1]|uniref:hypothetical protein n=1 Tax=Psychrobacter sp. Ps1 TaxID=2790955 RepID=UPI001EE12E8D|nr:hypothetical protein [Psychrobacter sp. Ps1]MCG3842387.1 hypothetical protein [Psychrobacter sp. Ps1]